jgi:hypothetical protein
MFNKAILVDCDFPFPMFLTTMHMTFATVMTQVLSRTTDLLPGVKEVQYSSPLSIPQRPSTPYSLTHVLTAIIRPPAYPISQKKVDSDALYKKIFPIALFFAFSLVFSNYAYVYLSVAYIQVLCALHTAVTRQELV